MALEKDKVGLILLGASKFPKSKLFSESEAFHHAKERIKIFFIQNFINDIESNQILDLFDKDYDPNRIDDEITNFISNRKESFKDLLIYYVGHGAYDNQNGFLLTIYQTKDSNLSVSSVTAQTLGTTLSKVANKIRLFLILDCCFAAGLCNKFQSIATDLVQREIIQHFPENGLALLCATSKDKPAIIIKERSITMFTEAFDSALKNGDPNIKNDFLTLRQLRDITYSYIKNYNPGEAVMPEVHSPKMPNGDIADLPHFPNFGFRSGIMMAYNIEARKNEIEETMSINNIVSLGKLFLSFVRDFDTSHAYEKHKVILIAQCNELEVTKPTYQESELYNKYLTERIRIYDEILTIIYAIYYGKINSPNK